MPKIRLILADVDGTLVRPGDDIVSPAVRQAVLVTQASGVKVCAVTGRPYEMAEPVFRALALGDPCVTDGGATIVDPNGGDIVWRQWLQADQIKEIIRILTPYAARLSYGSTKKVQSPGDIDLDTITTPLSDVWANIAAVDADEVLARIHKLPGVIAHANPEPGGEAGRMGVQTTHYQADKSYGVSQLLVRMGIRPSEVLAIGDGDNDIPLFTHAAVKVAVGNATGKLKALADYTVAPVADDGFAEMVERLILDIH